MSFPEWGHSYNALHVPLTSDGESVTRIPRDAVRNGSLIPAIDRAWGGRQRN